jgi:IS1 family transposase
MSITDTADVAEVSPTTVLKLLTDVGAECSVYLHFNMVKLPCTIMQIDEMLGFCGMKEQRVPLALKGLVGYGDIYTWTAICADTKIVPCFLVGRRDSAHAHRFLDDLAWRLPNRIQLSSDGFAAYPEAVEQAFGGKVDFGRLKKKYGGIRVYRDGTTKECGSNECSSITKEVVCGRPDPALISTSFVERQNRNMRSGMRRLTRKTDAFSKKLWNHKAMTAIYFMYYNYSRIHKTLRCTPAQEAGLSKHVWSLEEIVKLAA